jgi:hypothetical protein
LAVVIALQLGLQPRRAFAAVVLVVIFVAVVVAAPQFREDINLLRTQHDQWRPLSSAEAQVEGGIAQELNVDFLAWAREQMKEGETIHLEVGAVPGEELFGYAGTDQQAALAWASYQLAPHLLVEQSPTLTDVKKGEGRNADWMVFYEMEPSEYPGHLSKVLTYAPKFAIAKVDHAG